MLTGISSLSLHGISPCDAWWPLWYLVGIPIFIILVTSAAADTIVIASQTSVSWPTPGTSYDIIGRRPPRVACWPVRGEKEECLIPSPFLLRAKSLKGSSGIFWRQIRINPTRRLSIRTEPCHDWWHWRLRHSLPDEEIVYKISFCPVKTLINNKTVNQKCHSPGCKGFDLLYVSDKCGSIGLIISWETIWGGNSPPCMITMRWCPESRYETNTLIVH